MDLQSAPDCSADPCKNCQGPEFVVGFNKTCDDCDFQDWMHQPNEDDFCPIDCKGDQCEGCESNDEPNFPAGSNQGYYPN